MKKPVKTPPQTKSEVSASKTEEGSAPSITLHANETTAQSGAEAAPTLDPPSAGSSFDEAFGAGVWNNDKRINALYTANETRNSWVGVVGIGWVKFANNIDSANAAFTILAASAKLKNSPVNYNLDGGLITEMYVW